MTGYYYLHTNGKLIYKPAIVVDSDPDYFNSNFVKKVWSVDPEDRANAWLIALEALASGLNISQAKELSAKWGLTLEDFCEFIMRNENPSELSKRGATVFAEKILNKTEDGFWEEVTAILEKQKQEADAKCVKN